MNKEELLMKNFELLSKNPQKNHEALLAAIQQLIIINPKLGMRCWEECIKRNLASIETEFGKLEFGYDGIGRHIIGSFEYKLCRENYFESALEYFAKNKYLLEIIYTKSPVSSYFSGSYAISYLIRKERFQEADNILSAIYKNKTFTSFSEMWDSIIGSFVYGDSYSPGGYLVIPLTQPEHIRDFCMGWIDRIKDEEEQAGAMTFALKMF